MKTKYHEVILGLFEDKLDRLVNTNRIAEREILKRVVWFLARIIKEVKIPNETKVSNHFKYELPKIIGQYRETLLQLTGGNDPFVNSALNLVENRNRDQNAIPYHEFFVAWLNEFLSKIKPEVQSSRETKEIRVMMEVFKEIMDINDRIFVPEKHQKDFDQAIVNIIQSYPWLQKATVEEMKSTIAC